MTKTQQKELNQFIQGLKRRNPGEREFHQAVYEVAESVLPFTLDHPKYRDACILERMTEPDRIIIFRVAWEDDAGNIRANRGYRVQFSNAIGPYKGGLRFDKGLTLSILKFLGFEQVFKNSLTGLPMGGAKGGADFNPKGKSDREVMRFCQSLMTELYRHIGDDTDIPAGDIGVGGREISYLFGQYKRIVNKWDGSITGKGLSYGGSHVRIQATGYGAALFMAHMLAQQDKDIADMDAAVSGSGNVALYCIEKLNKLGVHVLTASDSEGFIYDKDGISGEKLAWLTDLKENRRGRIREYAEHFKGVEFHEGKPWGVKVDIALPCATQNELEAQDAQQLIDNNVVAVAEGANMPCTPEAVNLFHRAKVLLGPGKAANAGGVAVSGLERSQNAQHVSWSREEVEKRLEGIMEEIHERCLSYGEDGHGYVDYVRGANIAGFVKVADAMLAYGVL